STVSGLRMADLRLGRDGLRQRGARGQGRGTRGTIPPTPFPFGKGERPRANSELVLGRAPRPNGRGVGGVDFNSWISTRGFQLLDFTSQPGPTTFPNPAQRRRPALITLSACRSRSSSSTP